MSSIQNIRADIIKQFLSKHNEVTTRGMYASDIVAGIKLIAKTKSYSPMSHFSNQASVKSIIENTQLYEIEEDVVGKKKTWKILEKPDIVHSLDEDPINIVSEEQRSDAAELPESSDIELSILDDKSEEFDLENNIAEKNNYENNSAENKSVLS